MAAQLVSAIPPLTKDVVFPSVWSDEDHLKWPPNDRFITLFAHRFPVDQTDVSGGGQLNTAFDAQLRVTAFVRVEADLENRSPVMLEQEVYGVYKLTHDIVTALQMFDPLDPDHTSGLRMFRRPMRLVGDWSIQPKSGAKNSRWAVVPTNWECSFVADLGYGFDGLVLQPGF